MLRVGIHRYNRPQRALIHREPFVPLVVAMTDGQVLRIPHPQLEVNGGGAGFFGPGGGLADFEFKNVRSIRLC
jgi:hypothetical protein